MPKRLTPQEKAARTRAKNKAKHIRERKRQARADKAAYDKGRTSLVGVDRTGLRISIDHVLEGKIDCPLEVVDGCVIAPVCCGAHGAYADMVSVPVNRDKYVKFSHVRLKCCPQDVLAEIRKAFGCLWIQARAKRFGRWSIFATPAIPAVEVYKLFAAIWPLNWKTFAWKYIVAYSDSCINPLQCDPREGMDWVEFQAAYPDIAAEYYPHNARFEKGKPQPKKRRTFDQILEDDFTPDAGLDERDWEKYESGQ